MMTIYAVDADGRYLGSFGGGTVWEKIDGELLERDVNPVLPAGASTVEAPPQDVRQTWDGSAWSAVPPAAPVPPSPREWLERLPADKQAAVAGAVRGNDDLFWWFMKASGSTTIDVTLPETIAGVSALVAAGVLSAEDQAVLLAP